MQNFLKTWLFLMLTMTATALIGCGTEDDADCGDEHAASDASVGDTDAGDPRNNGTYVPVGGADAGAPAPDAGTTPPPDAGTPVPVSPAPLRSPSAGQLRFADLYIGGAACGQVRGNLPGASWSTGPAMSDTDGDHELELALAAPPAGTYELTYVSATCPGGSVVAESWASYGSRAQLLGMTADARAFVSCNWWDAAAVATGSVSSPGCNLRIQIDTTGNVTGAGNMRNYR